MAEGVIDLVLGMKYVLSITLDDPTVRCKPGKHLPFEKAEIIKPVPGAHDRFMREGCSHSHCPHCLFHLEEAEAS